MENPQQGRFHSAEEWVGERARDALTHLRDCTEVNADTRGGVPVLRGTRIPVAHILAEMSEGLSLGELADDFGLDRRMLQRLLMGLSIQFDRRLSS